MHSSDYGRRHSGRKWGVIIGQILTTIGAAFQAGSQGRGQYMGARFILGFGIAFNMCAAATLLSELAHPQFRGILVSLVSLFSTPPPAPSSAFEAPSNHICLCAS